VSDVYLQTGNVVPETSIEITLPRIIGGVSRGFDIFNKFGLSAALDLEMTFDGKRNVLLKSDVVSVSPSFGLELDYAEMAYMRLGAGQFQQVKDFKGEQMMTWQPNFGIGIRLKYFSIDYALTDVGDQAEALYSHVFSVLVRLNDKKD
jgi:hypothetical protein